MVQSAEHSRYGFIHGKWRDKLDSFTKVTLYDPYWYCLQNNLHSKYVSHMCPFCHKEDKNADQCLYKILYSVVKKVVEVGPALAITQAQE